MLLAIDPGKEKCGVALFDDSGKLVSKKVVERWELKTYLGGIKTNELVIGLGAFGRELKKEIKSYLPNARIDFVSEINSSRQARRLYWREHPPRGLWRLIPTSLRTPPVPIDDYAAVILGERHLKG